MDTGIELTRFLFAEHFFTIVDFANGIFCRNHTIFPRLTHFPKRIADENSR